MSLSAGCAMENTDSSASAENAPKSIGTSGIRRHIRRWYRGNEVGNACSVPNFGVRDGAAVPYLSRCLLTYAVISNIDSFSLPSKIGRRLSSARMTRRFLGSCRSCLRMYSHSLRIASPRDSGLLPTMCASSGVGVTTPPMAPRVVRPDVCGDLMTRCLLSFFPLIGMRFLRSTTRARENLAGPVERDVQCLGEVLPPAEQRQLARAHDRAKRLLANLGEDQCRSVVTAFLRQTLERVDAGRVDRRNVLHAKNENLRRPGDLRDHFLELRRRAEKERTVDGIDFDAIGDLIGANVLLAPAHLRDLSRIFAAIEQLIGNGLDMRNVAHAIHEKQRCDYDP